MSQLRHLVEETLYDLRQSDNASSISANLAGLELLDQDDSVLPIIEEILLDVVSPELSSSSASLDAEALQGNRNLEKLKRLAPGVAIRKGGEFRGLSYVLGAYLKIGLVYSPSRAFAFLRSCNASVRERLLEIVLVFFDSDDARCTQSAIKCLKDYLEEEEAIGTSRMSSLARRNLDRLFDNE